MPFSVLLFFFCFLYFHFPSLLCFIKRFHISCGCLLCSSVHVSLVRLFPFSLRFSPLWKLQDKAKRSNPRIAQPPFAWSPVFSFLCWVPCASSFAFVGVKSFELFATKPKLKVTCNSIPLSIVTPAPRVPGLSGAESFVTVCVQSFVRTCTWS